MRRLFFAILGLGAGLAIGAVFVRRVDRAARKLAPATLANQAARRAGTLRERLRTAAAEGRAAMAEREAELRAEFGLGRRSG